ncbi:MAG TPA: PHP domain-containing protein [Bacteroidetes bacterium]|nr:PHP domain-containing protein [Candidatus Limimorpha avicola]
MELKKYRADLHLHTVLSPCGDIYMSPSAIVEQAKKLHLDAIAITDHNTTRQVKVTRQLGIENGLLVIGGVEITTMEEAHALAYFETDEQLDAFQEFLDAHLPHIPNDEERFGYQLIVDKDEEVVGEEACLLLTALDAGLDELYDKVHEIGGLFVPAHVNKPAYSLMSQLGFVPPDIKADALEISKHVRKEDFLKKFAYLKRFSFIKSSDAHFIHIIGEVHSILNMYDLTFDEFRRTLKGEDGRFVETEPKEKLQLLYG